MNNLLIRVRDEKEREREVERVSEEAICYIIYKSA